MLNEKQAWECVYEAFLPRNLNHSDKNEVYNIEYFATGICSVISGLTYNGIISRKTSKKMFKKIVIKNESGYLYPTTVYGARKRREFCRKRIEEL